jgi:hypothetical protein
MLGLQGCAAAGHEESTQQAAVRKLRAAHSMSLQTDHV